MATSDTQTQSPHWVDKLQVGISTWKEKRQLDHLHVDDMKTPSGRVHTGSLRGVLLHDVVAKALQLHHQGVVSTYVFNDMDPMDGLPSYLSQEMYQQHMGKPLYKIPTPPLEESGIDFSQATEEEKNRYRNAKNFAEFYAFDFIDALRELGCSQEIVWSHELYGSGQMDQYIAHALNHIDDIKRIYREVAEYELPNDWYPFQVFCEQCGKLGSTLVTNWDGEKVTYECQPNKVEWAQGCGNHGMVSPFGGTGKLLWKVDWPAHWAAMGVNIEGAGKDHTSAGGSRDMADALCAKVFNITTPFDIPYEWILIRGAKMSSSKGVGTSAREFVKLFPPQVGRFLFTNIHYSKVIDFDPATMAIPDLFDEYDMAARIYWKQEEGDLRLGRSFELSQTGEIPTAHFLPRFRDVALWMQHPEIDLVQQFAEIKGSELNELELAELEQRKHYAHIWIEKYATEEYQLTPREELPSNTAQMSPEQKQFFIEIVNLISSKQWVADELQQAIFNKAKESLGARPGFEAVYLALLGKKAGPRAAWLLLHTDPQLLKNRTQQLTGSTSTIKEWRFSELNNTELLSVSEEIKTNFPSITLGFAIIRGVNIQQENPRLEEEKNALLEELQTLTTERINEYPEVQSYRKLYKATGIDWHSRRPSPEALLRRIAQGKGLYQVNTCVDAYNLVVMKHRISIGAFDLSNVQFPTHLQQAKGGELIHLLGDGENTVLKPGEISYFDQLGPYNLDFNYRDSQRTKVTLDSKDLLINVDGVFDISREQVEQTLVETIAIIQQYCGGTVEVAGIIEARS